MWVIHLDFKTEQEECQMAVLRNEEEEGGGGNRLALIINVITCCIWVWICGVSCHAVLGFIDSCWEGLDFSVQRPRCNLRGSRSA